VRLQTAQGDIVLALDPAHAPVTTANFLHYVEQKRFDGAQFYRAVPIGEDGQYGLLQGGLYGTRLQPFKPIAHEAPAVTGLHHVDGAVSMARGAPGTAASEFFIVIGALADLDGKDDDPGYAVFGHVESGMDVVRQLLAMPRSADAGGTEFRGQMLVAPVKIISARRLP
jgi:peptidyl-prolyl cis-trans isomerase A (cyclophilin A)